MVGAVPSCTPPGQGLAVEGLTGGYGASPVLDNLSLHVPHGTMAALLAPNGAGKSTLLNLISGVLPLRAGRIEFAGQDLGRLPARTRARCVATVPQALSVPSAFSVRECVSLGRTPYLTAWGGEHETDREQVAWAMSLAQVTDLADRRVGEISGGERQRVALALALAQEPSLLLLDEATANLDLHHQVEVLSLVRRLSRERTLTVLAAIHDPNLAGLFFDQLHLLAGGRIVAGGTPEEVLCSPILESVFELRLTSLRHPVLGTPLVFWHG